MLIGVGLRVAREDELPPVGRREVYVEQLHLGKLVQDVTDGEAGRVGPKLRLQGDVQAVGEEGDEDMRLDARRVLMIDRPDGQFVLEGLEDGLDLDQVQVVLPELRRIGSGEVRAQEIPAFSPAHATWNVGVIQGGKARNVIAGDCRFTYEWRPLPGQDPRRALRLLEEACQKLADDSGGRIRIEIAPLRTDAAAVTSADAEIVRFLETESGNRATTVPFGTELPEVIGMGAEACVFGPGDIRVAHRTGEHVAVSEVERAVGILERAVARSCG